LKQEGADLREREREREREKEREKVACKKMLLSIKNT
jgi:hypothetical protein